jgi:PhzF family phenazine biosynthesis protein
MEIKLYQLDAFTSQLFHGNPAAVCYLDNWLADDILQNIAMENNLSETAFIVPREGDYHIRWFTPKTEMDLCGHATLATAYVVFNYLEPHRQYVTFFSLSGKLILSQDEEGFILMDFPALSFSHCEAPANLIEGLGIEPEETYKSKDYLAIFSSEKIIREIVPRMELIASLDLRGLIISAKGDHTNFVSRFFAPQKGVPEDPVTGSAHCVLTPYWAKRLGKNKLHAKQLSVRGGEIFCEHKQDRVILKGKVVPYLSGIITL